jgi:polyhydroxybutyrate depolymerase
MRKKNSMRSNVTIDGRTRTYTVVGDQHPDRQRDLVMVLHGSKQTGEVHRTFTGHAYDGLADGGGAVVAYLDGHRKNWNDARKDSFFPARTDGVDDVELVRRVVGELQESHGIDPSRVFVIGYSNGGQMVLRLIHEVPELLAGATVISATMPAPENFLLPADETAAVPLPVLLVHGTKDPIVSYEGGSRNWFLRRVFKAGGPMWSAQRTAAYLARRNGILDDPVVGPVEQAAPPARTWVEQTDYRQDGRPPVRLLTVHGGGHTVPGPKKAPFVLGATEQRLSTAEAVADFFGIARGDHPRPQAQSRPLG